MSADFAKRFINVYGEYFHERKRTIDMKSASATPKLYSYSCVIPFQPLEQIKETLACTSLQLDITATTKRLNSKAGSLYLRGLLLNNDARKSEAIELFANALPEFARLIAVKCDVKEGLEHDLVADFLLQNHHSALKMLNISRSNHLVRLPAPSWDFSSFGVINVRAMGRDISRDQKSKPCTWLTASTFFGKHIFY